ncbi:hypothetical protein BU24DRAFT_421856 [Aaosphaeria arxii CBS 175.79]|uniref:Mso1 N-terminal domain-containing protein n=1 Tax=Aaosphaeria arxii CBS 175.79 TaxID=1450172 RepID=A0A6A5XTI0_9PLEO|nr:uncharacterized protein BU24DRAFT_421856 [Aaosphaeria arxii CBS 175.79]KAF2015554.1 hypothetical protein BU24DRAFT_421856 [Aaosphaeria arxii CBS 175.79]
MSYFSNLLTTTTSRYNNLRRNLLNDDADGDTEDESHISRTLRAYYTEKGRPFPQWLPPDPTTPSSAPQQFVSSSGRNPSQQSMGRGGGLSDLWDAPSPNQQQQEPASLRRTAQGRGGGGGRTLRPGMSDSLSAESQYSGRPLPSQRAGSYQSVGGQSDLPSPPPSAGSGTTAQERLKARLWGSARSTSPSQSQASSPSTSPAPTGLRSPFDRTNGGTPGARPPYPDDRRQQQTSYGMPRISPYPSNDDQYGPPSSGYGGAPQQRPPPGQGRVGLPSGPRMR